MGFRFGEKMGCLIERGFSSFACVFCGLDQIFLAYQDVFSLD